MDLFDFFRDWELDQQCHYEQDRNALKRKEWERRNQEVQQDEDLFASGFNLFGEPYKTSKGDALANRLQNTLGNYDEMKDLLTNHSNQSHLVGIPKNSVPQTPVEKNEQNFFPEQRNRVAQCHQASSHSSSLMPPPQGLGPISSLGHEGTRKLRTDWPPGGHNPSCTQSSQANSQPSRSKHSSSHDLSQIRFEDLYNCQNDQHKSVSVDEPVPATSSAHSRRHNHSKTLSGEHSYKENSHSKSPVDLDFSVHGSVSPLPSTSLLLAGNGLSSQNFPPGLHSKTNMLQQKPTAYVRPMDGQDQVPNDSPELKPPTEIEDGYNSQPFGAILDGKVNVPVSKNKLPKLSIPQTNEVGLPNDPSCVEEILREMTHLWPPPLTGIHTPCKAEQSKFPIPSKDSQHLTSGYSIQKRCEVTNKPAVKSVPSVPQKSMLEDDLKLSSDEEDSEQASEKNKLRSNPVNGLPLPTVHGANLVNSSGGSGSSSESETSSESDSDSESSSSDSECNEENRNVTPEPEPPSTNKWQLDKWLNKVNPHNKTIINNQNDVHSDNNSEPQNSQQVEEESKRELSSVSTESDSLPKDKELLSPVREKNKPRVPQKPPESKPSKQKSPAHIETTPQRAVAKKQPKKVERTSSAEDYTWNKPNPTSSTPKEKDVRENQEPPKARTKATVAKTAPRKEQRTCTSNASEKKKARGTSKIVPKSREFIETDSASDSNTDQEEVLQVKQSKACTGPTNPIKSKDCTNNILSVSSLTSNSSSVSLDQSHNELEEPFSPLPVVQNELLSPLREFEEINSLWVKIDLSLLSRIPGQETFENEVLKSEIRDQGFKHKPQTPATVTEKNCTKSRRKHKCENSDLQIDCKKQRLDESSCLLPPCISPIPSSRTSSTKESKKTTKKREEKVFPPLLSPLGDEPVRRRHSSDNSSFSQDSSVTMVHVPGTSTRHKKNGSTIANTKVSSEEDSRPPSIVLENIQHHSEPDLWSSLPAVANINADSRRSKITFDETLHNADYYMQEAKRLKHKADALIEKFGKAVNYADAALSFIECGNAMERDPLEAKSPYTMYSETVELIRYAMRLKNFTSSAANEGEKKLAVLCYRCLSLLYLRMFKLKKDHAMKYSRSLMEYFKNSSKSSQAPSPWGGNGKNTETPSPMSLSPSPASSAGNNSAVPGSSSTGTVSIPQRIHHMAASHVNITNNVLRSYEHWDLAEKLTKENKEFFQDLNTVMEPLTQHSTMTDLVRYVRQGLHWLCVESQLL
ncbi:AF4/FMR2 family member 2 isoform 2-T2 [Anomaloglossus baeobatrachus]|uniref:AF4/FMR2 family member 2 isoform X2 n=1 Tax=Anomaloglossus baeobatrachus TaxID=238106 RepID=UPI003F5064E4